MSGFEITNVIASASRAYDDQDHDRFLSHFTSAAVMRIRSLAGEVHEFRGTEGIRSASAKAMAVMPNQLRHLVFTPWVEFESDTIAVARYHQLYLAIGVDSAVKGSGDYTDRFEKGTDGRWLISQRDLRFLSSPPR